jgi:hypothetical protein
LVIDDASFQARKPETRLETTADPITQFQGIVAIKSLTESVTPPKFPGCGFRFINGGVNGKGREEEQELQPLIGVLDIIDNLKYIIAN